MFRFASAQRWHAPGYCFVLCSALLLGFMNVGCSLNTRLISKPMKYANPIKVEKIYVYSFLDFREQEIGKLLLDEFKTQLTAQLKLHDVTVEQLWYTDSPVRSELSMSTARTGVTKVPVKEVVFANAEKEKIFKPTHILIIFPSSVEVGGAGPHFNIRWTLKNTVTYKDDWTAETFSHSMNWVNNSENYVERAQQLTEFIVNEMVTEGVIH